MKKFDYLTVQILKVEYLLHNVQQHLMVDMLVVELIVFEPLIKLVVEKFLLHQQ